MEGEVVELTSKGCEEREGRKERKKGGDDGVEGLY